MKYQDGIEIVNWGAEGNRIINVDSINDKIVFGGYWEQHELERLHENIKLLSKKITEMKKMSKKQYKEFWEE